VEEFVELSDEEDLIETVGRLGRTFDIEQAKKRGYVDLRTECQPQIRVVHECKGEEFTASGLEVNN
jgi:hypothetical protein